MSALLNDNGSSIRLTILARSSVGDFFSFFSDHSDTEKTLLSPLGARGTVVNKRIATTIQPNVANFRDESRPSFVGQAVLWPNVRMSCCFSFQTTGLQTVVTLR